MAGIQGPGCGGSTPSPSAGSAGKAGSKSVGSPIEAGASTAASGLPSLDKTASFSPELTPDQVRSALQAQGRSSVGALGLNFSSPTISRSIQEFQSKFPPGSARYDALEKMSTRIANKLDPNFKHLDPMEKALRVSDINALIMQEFFSSSH